MFCRTCWILSTFSALFSSSSSYFPFTALFTQFSFLLSDLCQFCFFHNLFVLHNVISQLTFLPSVVYSDRTKETKNSQRMECLFNYTYIPLVLIGIHSMNRIIKIHISTHNSILKNFVFG